MNGTFGWKNRLPSAVGLVAGSQVAGLDVGKLQNDQGGAAEGWQTVQGVVTSAAGAWFRADAGAAVTWRAFSLHRTNLTPGATVRWRVGNDPAFATWTYDSGPRPGPARGYGQVVVVIPEPAPVSALINTENGAALLTEDAGYVLVTETGATGRYCRCDIEDPANPDGHLNVPLAYLGPAWTPFNNWGYESTPGVTADLQVVTSRGGQEFPDLRWRRRTWDIALPNIRVGEVWDRVMDLHMTALEGGNVLFVPNADSGEVYRQAIFGRLQPQGGVSYPSKSPVVRAWRAQMTERL
jgi:hypothetical protein